LNCGLGGEGFEGARLEPWGFGEDGGSSRRDRLDHETTSPALTRTAR
jgi:hypothetical protein